MSKPKKIVEVDQNTNGLCAVCVKCGRTVNQYAPAYLHKPLEKLFADLNGEAFKAYYCETCAAEEIAGQAQPRAEG